jgi:hypothetical protein
MSLQLYFSLPHIGLTTSGNDSDVARNNCCFWRESLYPPRGELSWVEEFINPKVDHFSRKKFFSFALAA